MGTQFLKAAQPWAEAHLGHWGQGMRAAPPSEARCSVEDLPLEVHGLFLGLACCLGCCTSCFWRETEEHEADSPATLPLSSPLSVLELRLYPIPRHGLISLRDSRHPAWCTPPEPLLIPLTPLLFIISLLSTSTMFLINNISLTPLSQSCSWSISHWR